MFGGLVFHEDEKLDIAVIYRSDEPAKPALVITSRTLEFVYLMSRALRGLDHGAIGAATILATKTVPTKRPGRPRKVAATAAQEPIGEAVA